MADNLSLHRTGRITGSRIAGVLGISPYRTPDQVMREMVREFFWEPEEFDGNFVTDWGKEHELDAIAAYEAENEVVVENKGDDQLTVVHETLPIAVTPDGWIDDGLVEAKCPFRGKYTHWQDVPHYEAQMQLQELATGREWCDFIVWRREGTSISRHHQDENWWPSVWPEVETFLEQYNKIIESEELSEPYRLAIPDQRTDTEWLMEVAAYFELVAEQTHLALDLSEVKGNLQRLADGKTAKGGGLQVIARRLAAGGKGTVSYKKLAEDMAAKAGVELTEDLLDQYRGKPSAKTGGLTWAFKNISDKES